MENAQSASSTKVIKRYANRKLYDTERSCYVTLDEIAAMVKAGEDVRVVDNKSGDDLSAVTLAQIIFEEEKKKSKMPLSVLRNIIQSSSESFQSFINERVQPTVERLQGEWDKSLGRVLHREGESSDESAPQNVLQGFVKNSQKFFDDFQKRIDERVRETVGTAGQFAGMGREFDQLKTRVESLEKKLQALLMR